MVLRFFIAVFVLFTFNLHALSDTALLKRAEKFSHSSNKTNQFRAYNDYKNLYLRSLMKEDKKMKLKALEGIVESGLKLHIDVSQYAKELNLLKRKKYTKKTYKSSKKTQKAKPKKTKPKLRSSHRLKSVRWRDGRLVLKFDKKLRNNQVNYFKLYDSKKKVYKYVFDVHASMLTRSQTLKKQGIDKIKLAQYTPDTLRLVIQNKRPVKISFKKTSRELIIKMTPSLHVKHNTYAKSRAKTKRVVKHKSKNKTIVIDPGHGGHDPGAIGYKHYREKVVVLQIARYLRDILKVRGYRVYMTRDGDRFIKLRQRTRYANKKKADLFISIHANAVGKKHAKKAHGIESYFLDKTRSNRAKRVAAQENSADMSEMDYFGKETFLSTLNSHNIVASNKLAIDLQRGALASLRKKFKNVKDAGVRPAPFWVLVGAQMPAVLVEVGFITNPTEAKRLVNRRYQKQLARGLADGIERYFLYN